MDKLRTEAPPLPDQNRSVYSGIAMLLEIEGPEENPGTKGRTFRTQSEDYKGPEANGKLLRERDKDQLRAQLSWILEEEDGERGQTILGNRDVVGNRPDLNANRHLHGKKRRKQATSQEFK